MTRSREGSEDQPEADQPLGPPSRQTVTGVLICHDRSPHGDKGPATFWTRQALQECNPPGLFNVAVDKDAAGRKAFMRFASPEAFFRFTAINPVRNYYEILLEDTPVCLYFDIEHYSHGPRDDDKLDKLIQLVQQHARTQWDTLETADLNPVITTASRYSGGKFKHSFHAVFPSIGFSRNNGILKSFAQHVSSLPELQGLSAKGEPMPIIDTKVYSRNQVFRIVESWKFTDTPAKDAVLRFQPEREHCMANLLSTLVSNVRGVTT